MKEQIDHALNIGCPLLQALYMIDMMVGFRYRANRHYWNAPEEKVLANLKTTFLYDLERFGNVSIIETFFEYFELNTEEI